LHDQDAVCGEFEKTFIMARCDRRVYGLIIGKALCAARIGVSLRFTAASAFHRKDLSVWVSTLWTDSKKRFFSRSVGRKGSRIQMESLSFLKKIQFK
jgi:hypothetical protein